MENNGVQFEVRVYKDRKRHRIYYPCDYFERFIHNGYYEYHFRCGGMIIVYSSAYGYRCKIHF